MAAAVLELGKLDASPMEKTLPYFVCRVVAGSTETQPTASAIETCQGQHRPGKIAQQTTNPAVNS